MDRNEVHRRGVLLFEHIADMLTVLNIANEVPTDGQVDALVAKAEARLASILNAVDLLEP